MKGTKVWTGTEGGGVRGKKEEEEKAQTEMEDGGAVQLYSLEGKKSGSDFNHP